MDGIRKPIEATSEASHTGVGENTNAPSVKRITRVALARALILEGKSNVAVLLGLIKAFNLPEKHARYPEIYRAHLVMEGKLTKKQARAWRGPSIPRRPEEIAKLFEAMRMGVDSAAIEASLAATTSSARPARALPTQKPVRRIHAGWRRLWTAIAPLSRASA